MWLEKYSLLIKKPKITIVLLIVINFIAKSIPAYFLELGNDEVYYWTYAKYPDWSHFDHPPLVGILIKLFTFNLHFDHHYFIRLGSLVLASANIYLIYLLARKLSGEKAGLVAAFLYAGSIYFNIISGFLILPDTPQVFFLLLALGFLIPAIFKRNPGKLEKRNLIIASLFIGLGFLSKYHSLYYWFAIIAYILLFNRTWLKEKELYISLVCSLLLILPIIFWNIENNFISFTFHRDRVSLFSHGIHPLYFLRNLAGQIGYQHPILFGLFILAIVRFPKKRFLPKNEFAFLLILSLPLIFLFVLFSLFRSTLPHWSGMAYLSLLLMTSVYIVKENKMAYYNWVVAAMMITFSLILSSPILFNQVNLLDQNDKKDIPLHETGKGDLTLDMYGWQKFGEEMGNWLRKNQEKKPVIISNKWFPAAHLDYYVARPNDLKLLALGKLKDIHKYYWINKSRGELNPGDDALFITTSPYYCSPEKLYRHHFKEISPVDTISIERAGKPIKYFFLFKLKGYKKDFKVSD